MDRQYFNQNISPISTFHGTVGHTLDIISQVVGATYGPYGTFNLFKNGPDVEASKDGFQNITMMKFDGSIAATVHQMLLELTSQQAFTVGDGTTSSALIMAAVYRELMNSEILRNKYTPSEISRAMKAIQYHLADAITATSKKLSTPQEAESLVYTSTDGNEELTALLMELYNNEENLSDKNVLIDYSSTDVSYRQTLNGVNIKGSLMSQIFGNQDMDTCVLRNVEIIIVDGKVNIINDILNYVNVLKTLNKSLLIICSGVNENFFRYVEVLGQTQPEVFRNFAVAYTTANSIQNKDAFYDVLKLTNCTYLPENTEISADSIVDLVKGVAENVSIKDRKITLGGFTPSIEFENYLAGLNAKLAELEATANSGKMPPDEKMANRGAQNSLRSRIETLTNGVTTIYVGGDSVQRKSINYRLIEDGLKALQSTLKYGYTRGCNTTVMNLLASMISDQVADKEASPLYTELETCLLSAYISVYRRLILNRKVLSNKESMEYMMTDKGLLLYNEETDKVDIAGGVNYLLFAPTDLRGTNSQLIINPAQTDINIVQRAIDMALVLATSNTILLEDIEFDAQMV